MDSMLTDIVVGRRRLDPKRIPPSVRGVIGDREATKQWLFQHYRYLAVSIANRYFIPGAEKADVRAIAFAALAEACDDYNPAKQTFGSFARVVIERWLITAVKEANRKKRDPKREVVVSQLPLLDGVSAEAWFDEILGEDPRSADEWLREERDPRIEQLIEELSELEWQSLLLQSSGCTYKEISAQVGYAEKSVDNALQRARRKFKALQ